LIAGAEQFHQGLHKAVVGHRPLDLQALQCGSSFPAWG
jgi:hypothetical protein